MLDQASPLVLVNKISAMGRHLHMCVFVFVYLFLSVYVPLYIWVTQYNVWESSHEAHQWMSVIAGTGTGVRDARQASAAAEAPPAAARPSPTRAPASSSGTCPAHLLHVAQIGTLPLLCTGLHNTQPTSIHCYLACLLASYKASLRSFWWAKLT